MTYSGCTFYGEQTRQQEGQKQEQKQATTNFNSNFLSQQNDYFNPSVYNFDTIDILKDQTDCDSLTATGPLS